MKEHQLTDLISRRKLRGTRYRKQCRLFQKQDIVAAFNLQKDNPKATWKQLSLMKEFPNVSNLASLQKAVRRFISFPKRLVANGTKLKIISLTRSNDQLKISGTKIVDVKIPNRDVKQTRARYGILNKNSFVKIAPVIMEAFETTKNNDVVLSRTMLIEHVIKKYPDIEVSLMQTAFTIGLDQLKQQNKIIEVSPKNFILNKKKSA